LALRLALRLRLPIAFDFFVASSLMPSVVLGPKKTFQNFFNGRALELGPRVDQRAHLFERQGERALLGVVLADEPPIDPVLQDRDMRGGLGPVADVCLEVVHGFEVHGAALR
jgi:hypothetical protein